MADGSVTIEGVSKRFTTSDSPVLALADVSFSIAAGEFVSVVGPSGCGKTTLLRLIAGLADATVGRLLISGSPVKGPQSSVGLVFQRPVLLPWRTALRNVLLPIEVHRRVTEHDRERAMNSLALVGLAGFEQRYPQELSGGMQQRVAISRALIQDPAVLLMDEPFGAVDALTREQLNAEVNKIWRATGKTIMLITHSISEAVFLAERVVVMAARPGKVIQIVDVDMPKDRVLEMLGSPRFGEIASEVRGLLGPNSGDPEAPESAG